MTHLTLSKMSKEQIIKAVKDYGCGKLKSLPLDFMSKEEILKHLEYCQCELLIKLKQGKI